MRILRTQTAAAALSICLLACHSDSGTGPVEPVAPKPITIVAGAGKADTIGARLLQALVVEVRVNGVLKPGVIVRFEGVLTSDLKHAPASSVFVSRLTSNTYSSFAADSTDGSGRARVLVQLGTITGEGAVVISVPDIGVADTARYTVKAGNLAKLTLNIRDTVLSVGGSYLIGASVSDRGENAVADVPTFATSTSNASVDATGVVRATAAGRSVITVRAGTFSDSSKVMVVPDATIIGVTDDVPVALATVKLDGTGLKRLTSITSTVVLPRFNLSGSTAVFYEGNPSNTSHLYTVDPAGSRLLVNINGPLTQFFPVYSSDGTQLFFNGVSAFGGSQWELWRAQADGSQATKLLSVAGQNSVAPSPSPDGTKLVFSAGGVLAILDVATKSVTKFGVSGDSPKYSPDGKQIVFLAPTSGSWALAIMNSDGTNVRTLPVLSYDAYSAPNWSSDGGWIIVRHTSGLQLVRASNFELFLLKVKISQASFKP